MPKLLQITAILFAILSTPLLSFAGTAANEIANLAGNSSCASYSWKNRGHAPAGYIKGVALSFARSLCREKGAPNSGLMKILAIPSINNTHKDVLSYYQSILSARGINTAVAGESAIHAVYSVGIGLGMRESSGTYCEGWDTSAGAHRLSAEAEAGPFQTSYDSMGASIELRHLYEEYQASPQKCFLETFKQGASCHPRSILGTGAGAQYQAFTKSCPAFAAEYAMTLLRLQRSHFGPINRREAEVVPACVSMLKNVQQIFDQDPERICSEIY